MTTATEPATTAMIATTPSGGGGAPSKRRTTLKGTASFAASMRQMSLSPTPMTRGVFLSTFISVTLGTFLEFLDFSLFASLDYILKPLFNISGTVYWAIFALGFVSRPVGAVVFGWVGDSIGRRAALLITIVGVAAPTALIGCLPTYQHIGAAAPALLAILRALQGLAVGGEYGSALIYTQETAPPRWQATMVDTMSASSKFATIVGILIVAIIQATCTREQMDVWAWRVPFLVAAVLGGTALVMRRFMPESHEFTERRALLAEEDALLHVEDGKAGGNKGSRGRHQRHSDNDDDDDDAAKHFPGSHAASSDHGAAKHGSAAAAGNAAAAAAFPLTPGTSHSLKAKSLQRAVSSGVVKPVRALSRSVSQAAHRVNEAADRHQAPFFDLAKHHWEPLALHFCFLIYLSADYYVTTSLVPSAMRTAGIAPLVTNAMTIVALVILLSVAILTGVAIDRCGLGIFPAYAAVVVLATVARFAAARALAAKESLGAMWGMMAAHGLLGGVMHGTYPVVGNQIYPPEVRASGMNIGHNLAASIGGLTPTFISLIKDGAQTKATATYAIAIWFTITGAVSLLACALLYRRHRWGNYTNAAGRARGVLAPWTLQQDAHDRLLARGNGPHAPHVPETVAE